MEVEAITISILKRTLRAWRQGDRSPDELLSLDLLRPYRGISQAERRHHLQQHLLNLVVTQLAEQRRVVNIIPITVMEKTDLLRQVTADFSHSYPKLEAWSALYHRYLSDIALDVRELATAVPGDPTANEKLFQRRTNAGLEMLVDCLQQQEMAAHGCYQHQPHHLRRHLPPPDYAQLFGVEKPLAQLSEWLLAEVGPTFVSVEGMGGIGKTAVARATAYQLAAESHWHDILWLSARQFSLNLESGEMQAEANAARTFDDLIIHLTAQLGQTHLVGLETAVKLQRLQPLLKTDPYLIIIDNLETLADVDILIPHLEMVAQPTRFLLTSRHTMSRFPFVHCLPVSALSYEDSTALVQSELTRRPHIFILTEPIMRQIYTVIGGLPLALKLLAAQLGKFPLDELLNQLDKATPAIIYTYIYNTTWQALRPSSRRLLVDLCDISPDGADLTWLRHMSLLPDKQFQRALAQLIDFCLLEPSGEMDRLVYKMHRLTTTFLQTNILDQWQGDLTEEEE